MGALPLTTDSGQLDDSIARPAATAGIFVEAVEAGGALLQEMLQEIKMARLTTEAATLR
jgi:hypothetical protein